MVAPIYFPSTNAPVSSTVSGLTSVFGMGTGISLTRSSTTIDIHDQPQKSKHRTNDIQKHLIYKVKTLLIL